MAIVLSPYELFYIRELLAADNVDPGYKEISAALATKFDEAYNEWGNNVTNEYNLFIAFMKTNHYYETEHYIFSYSVPEDLVEIYDKAQKAHFKTRCQEELETELYEYFEENQFGITEFHFCLCCGKPIESGLIYKEAAEERHPHAYCCNDCFPLYMTDGCGSTKNWRPLPLAEESEEQGYEVNVAARGGTNLIEVWKPSEWVKADWGNNKLD